MNIEKIEKVRQTYKNTACFDIVEEKKETNPIKLCADSKKEMDDWILAILEFKECLLKDKASSLKNNLDITEKEIEKLKNLKTFGDKEMRRYEDLLKRREKLNQGLKISHKIQLYFTDMTNDEEPIVDAYAIGCQSKEQAQLAYNTLVSHMQLLTIKTPKNG